MEIMNYWVECKVTGPIISILKILKYQILIFPEDISSIFDEMPKIFNLILDLCKNNNESLCLSASNILFLIYQRVAPISKINTQSHILGLILKSIKNTEINVMNALNLYLLQTLCAIIDCSSEADLRKFDLLLEIDYLSTIMKKSADFLFTRVRFIYSVVLYVFVYNSIEVSKLLRMVQRRKNGIPYLS